MRAGVGGVTVSIAAFQAVDPGSTPGQRMFFLFFLANVSHNTVHVYLLIFVFTGARPRSYKTL